MTSTAEAASAQAAPGPIEIRPATDADNEGLLSLSRAAPMRGAITVTVDRSPRYAAFSEIKGGAAGDLVAVSEGEVVGCASLALRRSGAAGAPRSLGYLGDLRVVSRLRGSGLAMDLVLAAHAQARAAGARLFEGVVLAGNAAALRLVEAAISKKAAMLRGGLVSLRQVLPYRRYREVPGFAVRAATAADLPAILELLAERYRGYFGAPIFDEVWLQHELSATPSFGVESFRVAERQGRIVACAAFWNQESLRRVVVLRFSLLARVLIGALRILRPLLRCPRPPRPGEVLTHVYLRFPAARPGEEAGLAAIVRAESNALRRGGATQFIYASFHEADPLAACVAGMWQHRLGVHLFHAVEAGDALPSLRAGTPCYVDFSLV